MARSTQKGTVQQVEVTDDFLYQDADPRTRLLFLEAPDSLSCEQWTDLLQYCFQHRRLLRFAKRRFDDLVVQLSYGRITALQKFDSVPWRHQEFIEIWSDFLFELRRRPYESPRSFRYRPTKCLTTLWVLAQFKFFACNTLLKPSFQHEEGFDEFTEEELEEEPTNTVSNPHIEFSAFELKDFRRDLQQSMPKYWYSTWTSFLMVYVDEREVRGASWIIGASIEDGIALQTRLCDLLQSRFPGLNRQAAADKNVLSMDTSHPDILPSLSFLQDQAKQDECPNLFEMALLLTTPIKHVQAQHILGVTTGTLKKRFSALRERHLKPAHLRWAEAAGD